MWEVIATVSDNDGSLTAAAEYLQVPDGLVQAAVPTTGRIAAKSTRRSLSTRTSTSVVERPPRQVNAPSAREGAA